MEDAMEEPNPDAIRTVISALGLEGDPYTPTQPSIRPASERTGMPTNYNHVHVRFQ